MKTVNPATNELLRTYDEMGSEAIEDRLQAASLAFSEWRRVPFSQRALAISAAASVLRAKRDELAERLAFEMGKPIRQGRQEVEKCAWVCEFYAEHAARLLADRPIETDARKSFVSFQPIGVVLAIMPWNFPLWQVFRFAAPALMAGNAAVLKHAANVPGCALAIEAVFRDADLPDGLFSALLISSQEAERLIAHPSIAAVTLTGSVRAGRAVGAAAGRALKKSVLELGGSDPYVVLADADLDQAAKACVESRMINGGQSCIAAKRFIVPESVREPFERLVVERMKGIRVGDPLDESTEMGPLARGDLRDEVHRQVEESMAKGARRLLGGDVPERPGAWYRPTVLTDVGPGMPAYEEEIFGPVAAILPVETEDEAIAAANDNRFGLGAAVFTRDRSRGEQIATERLEAGNCFVNAHVRSDPRLPFGGIKESGYGRELGEQGIQEFVNVKAVYLD